MNGVNVSGVSGYFSYISFMVFILPTAQTRFVNALMFLASMLCGEVPRITSSPKISLDYITVKIPRWPFDKFEVERKIGGPDEIHRRSHGHWEDI